MRRTPLRRTAWKKKPTNPLKRTPFKRKPMVTQVKKVKREKTPSVKTLRNKCDKLLTPLVKSKHPNCLLCPSETQVAHHHIKKSTSSALRYYLPNLLPLCHKCHLRLHSDEILWTGRVIKIKGLDWLADLEEKKNVIVKTNKEFYNDHYQHLLLALERET